MAARAFPLSSALVQAELITTVIISVRLPVRAGHRSAQLEDDVAAIYNILYRYLFDRHRDLTLPTSFLDRR